MSNDHTDHDTRERRDRDRDNGDRDGRTSGSRPGPRLVQPPRAQNEVQHEVQNTEAVALETLQPTGIEDDADAGLTRLAIRQAFEETDQYIETVASSDTARISELRRAGRAIARELGWKIQTAAVPADDLHTNVILVITQSTLLRDQAMKKRRERLMRAAIRKL
jgi:hypothetical protein